MSAMPTRHESCGKTSAEQGPLRLPEKMYRELIRLAVEGRPLEVCGILGGVRREVSAMYPVNNKDQSPDHFMMGSREQVEVIKDLRRKGLEMSAIYHSHPAGPDHPSAEDIRLAFYPDSISVIISLATKERPSVRAFSIVRGIVENVDIEVIQDPE